MIDYKKLSLCWRCKKCEGGCSWSQNFTPVKGWHAIPKKIDRQYDTYIVKKCPLFEDDMRYLKD